MKKSICLSVLIISLLIGCAQTPASSQFESVGPSSSTTSSSIKSNDEYEYEIVDNSVTIIDYIGRDNDVVVPDMIDGYPVKVISERAFFGYYGALELPNSVEKIGKSAFEQSYIKEFIFPPKVTVISECAFYESQLEKVTLPEHVQVIEGGAFSLTNLTEIFIPDSVTTFDDGFGECPRSLVLLYDNNPLVPQHAKECNLLCFKRSEYNPVMDIELVGGKPMNNDQNLGISQKDFNRVSRQSMNEIELDIQNYPNERGNFDYIAFEHGIYNAYSGFIDGDDLSQDAIKSKLTKLSTLLYQCGITEFDSKTINTGEVGCFDKLVTAALYCRWPDLFYEDVVIEDGGLTFADKQVLLVEAYGLFDFIPDASLVTGYSKQQQGIWYYPKKLSEVKSEALSFNRNIDDRNFTIKIKFIENTGISIEKTFNFMIVPYNNVGGNYHRIILKSIQ